MKNKKQNLGQFNTKNSAWLKPHIVNFIKYSGCVNGIDPFAGEGDLISIMNDLGLKSVYGFDIDVNLSWRINDSLLDIPYIKDAIVITNPPYLAKNSAKRNVCESYYYFEDNDYVDLYQIAIHRVLEKYDYAVFIIPETFVLSSYFKDYLYNVTIIEDNLFDDTDCPVCVACFKRDSIFVRDGYDIYKNDEFLFSNIELHNIMSEFEFRDVLNIEFNNKHGNLGLRAVDGVGSNDKIRFCKINDLNYDVENIGASSRSITVLEVSRKDGKFFSLDNLIKTANKNIIKLREKTHDVVLSPFKGNNKNGVRRRRLDYRLARLILNNSI